MSVKFWQEHSNSGFHHLRMTVWIKHWKPWGRLVFAWKGHANLWHVEGGSNMLLDNWMWNNGKSPTPFQLDAEYPNVVVVQLEQVGAHAANCTTPGLGASLQPLGIEPQADAVFVCCHRACTHRLPTTRTTVGIRTVCWIWRSSRVAT
jgi:hypothetical protein